MPPERLPNLFRSYVGAAGSARPTAGPEQSVTARVLVVDDDPQTLRYVSEALTPRRATPRW